MKKTCAIKQSIFLDVYGQTNAAVRRPVLEQLTDNPESEGSNPASAFKRK